MGFSQQCPNWKAVCKLNVDRSITQCSQLINPSKKSNDERHDNHKEDELLDVTLCYEAQSLLVSHSE